MTAQKLIKMLGWFPLCFAPYVFFQAVFWSHNINEALLSAALFIVCGMSNSNGVDVERLQEQVEWLQNGRGTN
jgi:hypothetical protein